MSKRKQRKESDLGSVHATSLSLLFLGSKRGLGRRLELSSSTAMLRRLAGASKAMPPAPADPIPVLEEVTSADQ